MSYELRSGGGDWRTIDARDDEQAWQQAESEVVSGASKVEVRRAGRVLGSVLGGVRSNPTREADDKTRAIIDKLRKGSGARFTLKQIAAALLALGGYQLTPSLMWVPSPSRYHNTSQIPYDSVVARAFAADALPAPKVGLQVWTDVGPLDPALGGGFVATRWEVEPSLHVRTPDGQQANIRTSTGRAADLLLAWLYSQTDLRQRAADYLGMGSVEQEDKQRHLARLQAEGGPHGTCPACFQIYKVDGKRMVLHGYLRPGDGAVHKPCFGSHRLAFEVSPQGSIEYRDAIAADLEQTRAGLAELPEAREIIEPGSKYHGPRKTLKSDVSAERWARLLRERASYMASVIGQGQAAIERLSAKIAGWHPADLLP